MGAGEEFEIVFVSSDKTAEDQMAYMKESHGDWLAVQHNTVLATQLKKVSLRNKSFLKGPKSKSKAKTKSQIPQSQIQNSLGHHDTS